MYCPVISVVTKAHFGPVMIDDLATERDSRANQRSTHFNINSQVMPTANTLMLMSPIGMAVNKLNHGALSSTIYNFAKSAA